MRRGDDGAGMSVKRLARIDPAMQAYVDRGVYAGISTIVARRGEIVHQGRYGFRDIEAGLPMTEDTIFRLYSMTKPIVCTALMTLFEEGKFHITDPIANYLPAFARVKVREPDGSLSDPKRPMTVRDAMAHTSGLAYNFVDDSRVCRQYAKAKLWDPKVSLADAIEDLAQLPLVCHPGSRWFYSVGIDVAARLIEVISGRSLSDFLKERIFEPLAMADTAFETPVAKRGRLAAIYGRPDVLVTDDAVVTSHQQWLEGVNERRDVSATYPVDMPATFQRGGHGLFGTASDYFRFAQMLANGGHLDGAQILGRKTLEFMHANVIPPELLPLEIGGMLIPGYGFGLGSRVALDVAQTGAPGSVGEFGWSGAAKTYYWVDPVEQVVGLFMTQSMLSFDDPELELRALAYQAIID
jgi:CubicO group peptidase (beta-lactamase class C family)